MQPGTFEQCVEVKDRGARYVSLLAVQASVFFLWLLHPLVFCSMLSACSSASQLSLKETVTKEKIFHRHLASLLTGTSPCCIQIFAEKDCVIPVRVWKNFKISPNSAQTLGKQKKRPQSRRNGASQSPLGQ